MSRLTKIECTFCGRKHDIRKENVGMCARCDQRIIETSQGWSSELFLSSIENVGVRGSYASYLNKIARLLGASDRRGLDWSAVSESVVVQVAKSLGKKLGSSVASAFRGLVAWFAENAAPVESTGCYVIPPTTVEEETPGLVKINGSWFFKATLKPARTEFTGVSTPADEWELEFIAA